MGQIKGNPALDRTPERQAYTNFYGVGGAAYRDGGMKPVMIDEDDTLDDVIDVTGMTSGYVKDTNLTDGSINAKFDTLTANEYHVTILSSSILYSGGGSKFGDSANDIHQFTGSLVFSGSTDAQTLAYAGGAGHMMMVDTNRTDSYTEIGTSDKPFKTLSAAIAAANTANPTGIVPYTFVMMGCNIDENIDFGGTTFNFITLATTCRTVFNGTVTIANNPNLKQLIIRNLEFAQPVTITGDGTTNQMNDMSFYNVSFSNTLSVSRANSLALWDVYSEAAVTLTNLNYLYVGGGQITGDITIVADSTLPLPSNGIAPGTSIIFDLICNNLTLTRGGTATYVLQPHNTRIGLNAGNYTIPTGFTVSAQASTFRGTWTNNGSFTLRNSTTDNAVLGTQPTYTGILGGTFKGSVTGSILSTNGVVSSSLQIGSSLVNYANDGAAATGGVPVGGLYHTAGTVKVRLT